MQQAVVCGKFIKVKFYFDKTKFFVVLAGIKSIPGRYYNDATKEWSVPDTLENRIILHKYGFILPEDSVVSENYLEPQKEFDKSVLRSLPHVLRNYQIEAVKFAEASDWNCILAMAPRLGKTIVSLLGARLHDLYPVLIVCPAISKFVWREAIQEWFNDSSRILYGKTPVDFSVSAYTIINFELLFYWKDMLATKGFKYFIVDESHRMGNTSIYKKGETDEKGHQEPVKVTEACVQLSFTIPHTVLLSGTPATSCIAQLQPQLGLFSKKCSNKWWFLKHFCDPTIGYGGHTDYSGFSNKEEFRKLTAPFIFRRTKQDVFTELPEEMHEFINMSIDTALYADEIKQLKSDMTKRKLTEEQIDDKISHFASLSYTAKRSQILQWITDFIAINNKLVVYCWYQAVAEDLITYFKDKAVMVNGTVSAANRQKNITEFNTNDKIKIFIGQISAVKESISLSVSDSVLFVEFGTANAGSVLQASERIWLPELKQKKLCYYYAVGDGSVEEARIKILQKRMGLINSAYNGKSDSGYMFGTKLSDII